MNHSDSDKTYLTRYHPSLELQLVHRSDTNLCKSMTSFTVTEESLALAFQIRTGTEV